MIINAKEYLEFPISENKWAPIGIVAMSLLAYAAVIFSFFEAIPYMINMLSQSHYSIAVYIAAGGALICHHDLVS